MINIIPVVHPESYYFRRTYYANGPWLGTNQVANFISALPDVVFDVGLPPIAVERAAVLCDRIKPRTLVFSLGSEAILEEVVLKYSPCLERIVAVCVGSTPESVKYQAVRLREVIDNSWAKDLDICLGIQGTDRSFRPIDRSESLDAVKDIAPDYSSVWLMGTPNLGELMFDIIRANNLKMNLTNVVSGVPFLAAMQGQHVRARMVIDCRFRSSYAKQLLSAREKLTWYNCLLMILLANNFVEDPLIDGIPIEALHYISGIAVTKLAMDEIGFFPQGWYQESESLLKFVKTQHDATEVGWKEWLYVRTT